MTTHAHRRLRKPLQQHIIQNIHEHADEDDNYAIVESTDDFKFAETLKEANDLADDAEQANAHLSPDNETVAIIQLQPLASSEQRIHS